MPDDVVYKYPLVLSSGEQRIAMPTGAGVVAVHEQHGSPALWARLAMGQQSMVTMRTFVVVATGEPFPDDLEYVGTVHSPPFVWHVLEAEASDA